MATYVLIPGGWCGGWIWKYVTPLLRTAGHEVYTPTLTGLGERVHLARPDVDLDLHIQDVVNVLEYEDLQGVVLVGWSYSGMVITGVADRVPGRLAQLVYLDAAVPNDGQSVFDCENNPAGRAAEEERARTQGDGWRSPPPTEEELKQWAGDPDDARLHWWASKLTAQPIKTFTQPIRLASATAEPISRAFILCTQAKSKDDSTFRTAELVHTDPRWTYLELASSHVAPVTTPREVVEALLQVV
jgi:pimeloyl-ACP methyl ester carboxylesterase